LSGGASFAVITPRGLFRCYYSPAGITRLLFPVRRGPADRSRPDPDFPCPFNRKRFARDLNAFLSGGTIVFAYPLDIAGTRFQKRIWGAMKRIPYGETRTYRQLAEMAGCRGAIRAAGSACGKNPVPILLPCHRVVRSDGGLGGFSAGLRWKKALLSAENGSLQLSPEPV